MAGSTKRKKSPKQRLATSRGKSGITHRDTIEDRVQIQFRIGEVLVNKMDAVADATGMTRNDWLIKTVLEKLNGAANGATTFVKSDITVNRIPILFRVGKKVRDAIDREVKGSKVSSRTTWMIEAILSGVEGYEFSGL